MELCSRRILIVFLVQALVDLIQALVALVQARVDIVVQALDALVQTHPPQGGLVWVVRRQVVVGPGSGLVGAVWLVFNCERGEVETGLLLTGIGSKGVNWLH